MALYDSADCLVEFNREAGRPQADAITDASKYDRLSKAQQIVVQKLSAIAPQCLYPKGAIPMASTVDQQIFTFGVDSDGRPIAPIGKTGIYPTLASIPNCPWREGIDYLNEGTQVRIPNNRTYAGTLYWRGITPPPPISASSEPVLFPIASRILIVIEAVRRFATEYVRNAELADRMANEWAREWPTACLVWKTQFRQGGALDVWTGRDLALASAWNYPI